MKSRGKPTTKAARAKRQAKAVGLMNDGIKPADIPGVLGISRMTFWRDLQTITERFQSESADAVEQYKRAQLAVFELMERSLLEGQIDTDTAREWRGIRAQISKLLGLNAPQRTITATVNADVDPTTLGRYSRFCHETRHLTDEQLEKVYEFARPMNVYTPATNLGPPATSELWDQDEPLQLTDGAE